MLALASPSACAAKRVALVIGNGAYANAPALANPKNDAEDMAAALKALGFTVILGIDLDKRTMDRKILEFSGALSGADAGVFHYSGHGLQVAGMNYLVPVDASLESTAALDFEAVPLALVQRTMERETKTNILFLDACRNNPLTRNLARTLGTRSADIGHGLAPAESGVGTLISFSTQPGNVALDGSGRNSPYSGPLAKAIGTPGEDILSVLTAVRNEVLAATNEKQVPWENHALRAKFYFNPATLGQPQLPDEMARMRERLARLEAELQKKQQVAVVAPPKPLPGWPQDFGTDKCNGLLVSVAAGKRPCIKPGSGESFKDCQDCPEMVVVPAGSFVMGSPETEPERSGAEGPQHEVRIAKPFAVGRFAVTFAEWDACVAAGGCGGHKPDDEGWGREDRPVINVSWSDAQAYVKWLSGKTGGLYRLLSEAEFEYAARAGTTTPFWWGSSITPEQANYVGTVEPYKGGGQKGENRQKTLPVNSFQPNAWGLYQVHGNVLEWMEDCWNENHDGAPSDGSARTIGDCGRRILRGGCWGFPPKVLRAAKRNRSNPDDRANGVGFRLARTID